MDILQEPLHEAIRALPALFLQKLIKEKLHEQGVTPTTKLLRNLSQHILSGERKSYRYRGADAAAEARLTFENADLEKITHDVESFCETRLSEVLNTVAKRLSKSILRELKSRWSDEHVLQDRELSEFRSRLEGRWGKPLDRLRMLLTLSREWCQETHNDENLLSPQIRTQQKAILIRMLTRACQVTDEIICLLENGFADGAMARWRTLHEINVVAAVISRHGEGIAERYLAHQTVESKRALDKYAICCKLLGHKLPSAREQRKILKAFDGAVAKYGKAFKSDYGWASSHLKMERPTFADLEVEAGCAEMRSYYQMGNDNVHAGIKSMFMRLGLLNNYDRLVAGRSNAGLIDPGLNSAHTLTQLSVLVCLSNAKLDDLVLAQMMAMLRDEIQRSFHHADKLLRKDAKRHDTE
jgi:hypothetical protein